MEGYKHAYIYGGGYITRAWYTHMQYDANGRILPKHLMACAFGLAYIGLGGNDYHKHEGVSVPRATLYGDVPAHHMNFIMEKTGINLHSNATDYGFDTSQGIRLRPNTSLWNHIMHLTTACCDRHPKPTLEDNNAAMMELVMTLREHGL